MSAYPPGLGTDQQASQATAAMRQEPWYQQLLTSWGIDPSRVDANGNPTTKLSDDQRTELMKTALAHGIGFNNKYDGIDENGQIIEEHHKLRNGLIAAAIGGAALTGFGAAGIGPLSGAFGAGAGAGAGAGSAVGAGTGAGTLASTTIGSGFIPAITGGTGLAGTLGGTTAALAGGGSALTKIGGLLGAAGKGIGDATTAAGNNDLNQEDRGLQAAGIDINGQRAYTDEALGVSKQNAALKLQHTREQLMAEKAAHPSVSPFNITGGPKYSPEYLSTLQQIAQTNPEFLTAPTPYTPITPSGAQKATGTTPSTLSKIGNILSPALTVAPKIASLFA
jgi:hypothetical protein